jgi:hypothetical protein
MIFELAIFAAFAVLLILMGLFGTESRPDFLDPNQKHRPFVTPLGRD